MNPRFPYAPDMNAPPGIPRGYPYGPTAMPTSNPMYPSFPSASSPMPNGPGYPASASPYAPANSPYSSSTSPYSSTTSFYPATNPHYPSDTSPYPATSPHYPSDTSPYPATGSPYSSDTSPYPATGSPYHSGTSPYPATGSPYTSGASPYPAGSSPYPPASTYPAGSSPYPPASSYHSSISPSQPANPYPTGGAYLKAQSSYPSPYPSASGYSPANSGLNYKMTGSSALHQTSNQGRHLPNMAHLLVSEGTVHSYPNFDPKQDAEILRKAMKGFGTDEKAIINVLAKRSNSQRVYICVAFKQLYGKDLIDDLKSELSGNFESAIIGLMTPANDFLASEVHSAISGVGTDEDVLIEVLCTRGNQEIWAINESYRRLYGKNLEDDIKSDTSGHFQRLLVSSCTGARSEDPADEERAKQNAHALFAAGVGQWGTDESVFNSILVSESFHQLAVTFYEYEKLAGHTVADAVDKEMSGDLKKGMLAIARSVENRPFYFAEKLYKAMKVGLGTDDRTLIRIIVSRCEVDMVQIKAEYERNYGKPLADAIHGDTSGDYRRILIALVDGC